MSGELRAHWTDTPHTHGGTDCGGGETCPCAPTDWRQAYFDVCDQLREANDAHDAMGAERDALAAKVARCEAMLADWERIDRAADLLFDGDDDHEYDEITYITELRAALGDHP